VKKQESDKIMINRPAAKATLAVVAFCTVFAANGMAQCGVSISRAAVAMPDALSAPQPALSQSAQEGTAASAAKPKDLNDSFSIVGLWNVNFVSGGVSVDQGFDLWNSDGTEILNDTPPPATGNVCLGVWTKTGPISYKLKHPSWTFDAGGNLNGTAVIRETITHGAGADSFQCPFTVDVFDLNGKNLMHLEGTITGIRITTD